MRSDKHRGWLSSRRTRGSSAATLAADLAGVSPAGGNCPVATVVISSDGEGDQTVESLEVKASVAAGKAANLVGERPVPSIARIRTASISDARGGNKPRCART